MKKLLVIAGVLLSVSSYGQEKKSFHPTIGLLGGFTSNQLNPSMMGGAWAKFNKIGIEFKRGGLRDGDDVNTGTFNNLGVFLPIFNITKDKDANVFLSTGAQFVENDGKKSKNPYMGVGIDFSFGVDKKAVIRTEIQFSKVSTFGIGLGYKF